MERTEVTTRAIVIQDNKILLIHRRKDGKEFFVLPGGGIDPGETPIEAVIREVYEETGLTAIAVNSGFVIVDYDGRECHIFYVDTVKGEPELIGEEKDFNSDSNWYNPEWFDISIIDQENVYPQKARAQLLQDLKKS